jgi:hypothetical protein
VSDGSDEPTPPTPQRLEYFAANAPHRRISRGLRFLWTVLALGWLPFGCGVATSQATVRSGLADLIHVHLRTGGIFMGLGLLISAACAVAFARSANGPGVLLATASFVIQAGMFFCIAAG